MLIYVSASMMDSSFMNKYFNYTESRTVLSLGDIKLNKISKISLSRNKAEMLYFRWQMD